MAQYFSKFPKTIYYPYYESTSADVVTNITARVTFEQKFKNNTSTYYEYDIQDGDTPEIIASKIYGLPERHWIVLMMNDIVDPQFDWPLDQRTLNTFIENKYSANASVSQTGIAWAQQNNQSYYKIETRTTNLTGSKIENKVQVDANTYANVALTTTTVTLDDGNTITIDITKEPKTYYDYEVELNESKRTIKLLKPEFVGKVETEFRNVI